MKWKMAREREKKSEIPGENKEIRVITNLGIVRVRYRRECISSDL